MFQQSIKHSSETSEKKWKISANKEKKQKKIMELRKYNNRFLKLAGWAQYTHGSGREENTLNLKTEN